MITTRYESWFARKRKAQSEENTLRQLDTINGENFRNQKISAIEASRSCYDRELVYFATFYDGDTPVAFLKANQGYLGFNFLDAQQRWVNNHQWTQQENGLYFLGEAQKWEYEGDTDQKIITVILLFKPSGEVIERRTDILTRETKEATYEIDPDRLWLPHPKFGQYDSFLERDRVAF